MPKKSDPKPAPGLRFIFRPRFDNLHPAAATRRCEDVLASWLRHYPASQQSSLIDFEDWAENAIYLHAIDSAGGALEKLPFPTEGCGFLSSTGFLGPRANPARAPSFMVGTFLDQDGIEPPVDANFVGVNDQTADAIGRYSDLETFKRYAGRPIRVADADQGSINEALASLHTAGHDKVFIKSRHKEFAGVFDLSSAADRNFFHHVSMQPGGEAIAWMPIQHEGARGALVIQGLITPSCEYRLLIVGDKPIAGAGCIEAFTPIDNTSCFDPRVERRRNDGNVISDGSLSERYRAYAEIFASEVAAELQTPAVYALDLCIDEQSGHILPIEMNPALNVGLYAMNIDIYIRGIISWVSESHLAEIPA